MDSMAQIIQYLDDLACALQDLAVLLNSIC